MYFVRKHWYVFIAALALVSFLFLKPKEEEIVASDDSVDDDMFIAEASEDYEHVEEESEELQQVVVDVKGEVFEPGVYEVDSYSRVNDVIKVADGLTDDANATAINLAERVIDEMIIIVPKIGEEVEYSQVVHEQGHSSSDKIAVNHATASDLESLPGIGPKKAEAIISYVEEFGPLKEVDDLLNVSGIGESTLDNIREDVQIP